MARLIIIILLIGGLGYFILKSAGMFYNPKRCRRCDGKGYWRGTRPDERITCDECFGTGKRV
ncbi:MAG: hypothetical protein AB8F95_00525 [Bacteroidia bacterium]